MYCVHCGNELPDRHKFCSTCGHKSIGASGNLGGTAPSTDSDIQPSNYRRNTNRVIAWYFGLTLSLTALLCLGAWFNGEDGWWLALFAGLFLTAFGFVYMLPTVIAWRKAHEHRWAVLIVNFFFGVTGVVWVILMVFSLRLIDSSTAVVLGALAPPRRM